MNKKCQSTQKSINCVDQKLKKLESFFLKIATFLIIMLHYPIPKDIAGGVKENRGPDGPSFLFEPGKDERWKEDKAMPPGQIDDAV